MYEVCSELIIKTTERWQWCRSVIFFWQLLIDFTHYFGVSIVDFEQVSTYWNLQEELTEHFNCALAKDS